MNLLFESTVEQFVRVDLRNGWSHDCVCWPGRGFYENKPNVLHLKCFVMFLHIRNTYTYQTKLYLLIDTVNSGLLNLKSTL